MRDSVAVISGAGKGLGRAYALELASLGCRVVVNNRLHPNQPSSAEKVVAEIRSAGGTAIAHHGSAHDATCGASLIDAAMSHWGRIDIVIANAGYDQPQSFHHQSMSDFTDIITANFFGTAQLLHAAWPHLRAANYGRVVVSTSTAGLFGNHGQTAYAASKAALIGLMRSLHLEGVNRGIKINAIAPYAHTPLTDAWFSDALASVFTATQVAKFLTALVSLECTASGRTFIVGGDAVREARMLETAAKDSASPAIFSDLETLSATIQPLSASAEFETFLNPEEAE
jgi:NAD(P)-dependent dehydrogenase (short-subunit alcohol dehydrogenase family)